MFIEMKVEFNATANYLSEKIADYAVDLELKDIPEKTINNAKTWIIDSIGATISGVVTEQGRIVCELAKKLGGKQESSIFHFGDKVSILNAVLANGTLGFALDIDDGHRPSDNHIGGVIIPTVLNMCEREGLGGRDMLLASILGCDVAGKVGEAGTDHHRGIWYSGSLNAFGATASAGKLLDLNSSEFVSAIGITGFQGGPMTHGWSRPIGHSCHDFMKSFVAGNAAQNGVLAALLAKEGFIGSPSILETICPVFAEPLQAKIEACVHQLGTVFEVDRLTYKLSFGLGSKPSLVQAIESLLREFDINNEKIEKVLIGRTKRSYERTFANLGFGANSVLLEPFTTRNAITSDLYVAAVTFLEGESFLDQFTPEKVLDPKIREFQKKIRVELDDELTQQASKDPSSVSPCVVTVKTKDGHEYRSQPIYHPYGYDITNPASKEDIEKKFIKLTKQAKVLNEEDGKEIIRLINKIEKIDNIDEIIEIIT
jgi:2-methylcitrate dehydratase PrpD